MFLAHSLTFNRNTRFLGVIVTMDSDQFLNWVWCNCLRANGIITWSISPVINQFTGLKFVKSRYKSCNCKVKGILHTPDRRLSLCHYVSSSNHLRCSLCRIVSFVLIKSYLNVLFKFWYYYYTSNINFLRVYISIMLIMVAFACIHMNKNFWTKMISLTFDCRLHPDALKARTSKTQ